VIEAGLEFAAPLEVALRKEGADYVARRVWDEAGLRTVVHQHIGTWIETEAEARRLFDMTDPSVLGLCLDTGHWTFGAGGDPVAAVREFRDRVWHVHFKDADPAVIAASRAEGLDGPEAVGRGVFCELGRGCVDFPGMLAALEDIGYGGWIVVEQDVQHVLTVADRVACFLEGRISLEGTPGEISPDDITAAYFGM